MKVYVSGPRNFFRAHFSPAGCLRYSLTSFPSVNIAQTPISRAIWRRHQCCQFPPTITEETPSPRVPQFQSRIRELTKFPREIKPCNNWRGPCCLEIQSAGRVPGTVSEERRKPRVPRDINFHSPRLRRKKPVSWRVRLLPETEKIKGII